MSVKHSEHKAASWKLHMGWILGQAESGSSNSKDGPEFENRKRNKTKPKGSREACAFSLMKPFPGLAAGTDRTAVLIWKCLQVLDVFCHSGCVLWIRLKTKEKQCQSPRPQPVLPVAWKSP